MTKYMTHAQRVKIAIQRYKKSLRKNGTSEFAVSLAVGSGLEFLVYYNTAHKKI